VLPVVALSPQQRRGARTACRLRVAVDQLVATVSCVLSELTRCRAILVTDAFSFAPGLSPHSTTEPSEKVARTIQWRSCAVAGFLAVKGKARYFPGSTVTFHATPMIRS